MGLGRWWIPRGVAVLHAVRIPDLLAPAGRTPTDGRHQAAGVLGSAVPASAAGRLAHPRCRAGRVGDPGRLGSSSAPRRRRVVGAGPELASAQFALELRGPVPFALAGAALLEPGDRGAVLSGVPAPGWRTAAAGAGEPGGARRGPRLRRGRGADRNDRDRSWKRPRLLRHRHQVRRVAGRRSDGMRAGLIASDRSWFGRDVCGTQWS